MVVGPAQLVVAPDLLCVPKLVRCLAPGMWPRMFADSFPPLFLHLQKTGRQLGMTGAVVAQIGSSWHQRQHATEQIHGCDLVQLRTKYMKGPSLGFARASLTRPNLVAMTLAQKSFARGLCPLAILPFKAGARVMWQSAKPDPNSAELRSLSQNRYSNAQHDCRSLWLPLAITQQGALRL